MKKQNKKKIIKIGVFSSVVMTVFIFSLSIFFTDSKFFHYLTSVGSQFSNIISGVLAQNTNDYRLVNKENVLVVSDKLTRSAQMKADDMAKKGYFSHTGPLGERPWVWFERGGYKYEYAGENLAVDFTESDDVSLAWINSAKHKANLLNSNFTEIGIGIAKGVYDGRDTTFVVQFFGKPYVEKTVVTKQKIEPTIKLVSGSSPTKPIVTKVGLSSGEVLGSEDTSLEPGKIWDWILSFFTQLL